MAKHKRNAGKQGRKAMPTSSVTTAAIPWDTGAKGSANLDRMIVEDAPTIDPDTGKASNPNGIKRARRRPWIETYRMQGKISDASLTAALRLYAAYQGYPARDPLAAIDEIKTGGRSEPMAATIDRRREFYAMWASVPRDSRPAVEHVVLNDQPLRSLAGCTNTAAHERHMSRLIDGLCAMG